MVSCESGLVEAGFAAIAALSETGAAAVVLDREAGQTRVAGARGGPRPRAGSREAVSRSAETGRSTAARARGVRQRFVAGDRASSRPSVAANPGWSSRALGSRAEAERPARSRRPTGWASAAAARTVQLEEPLRRAGAGSRRPEARACGWVSSRSTTAARPTDRVALDPVEQHPADDAVASSGSAGSTGAQRRGALAVRTARFEAAGAPRRWGRWRLLGDRRRRRVCGGSSAVGGGGDGGGSSAIGAAEAGRPPPAEAGTGRYRRHLPADVRGRRRLRGRLA